MYQGFEIVNKDVGKLMLIYTWYSQVYAASLGYNQHPLYVHAQLHLHSCKIIT
jgi:hypothetical protein